MFSNTRAAAKIRGVGERASGSDFTVFPCTCSWEIYWPVVAAIFFHTAQVSCVILFIIFNVHPRGGTPGKL